MPVHDPQVHTTGLEWTLGPALVHVKALLDAMDKRLQERFDATEHLLEERFHATNQRLEERFQATEQRLEERHTAEQEYVRARFADLEREMRATALSASTAVSKAEAATEKRFDSVNEFRSALSDQARLIPTRTEVDAQFKALEERVGRIQSLQDQVQGRGIGMSAGWGILVAAILAVAAVVGAFAALTP